MPAQRLRRGRGHCSPVHSGPPAGLSHAPLGGPWNSLSNRRSDSGPRRRPCESLSSNFRPAGSEPLGVPAGQVLPLRAPLIPGVPGPPASLHPPGGWISPWREPDRLSSSRKARQDLARVSPDSPPSIPLCLPKPGTPHLLGSRLPDLGVRDLSHRLQICRVDAAFSLAGKEAQDLPPDPRLGRFCICLPGVARPGALQGSLDRGKAAVPASSRPLGPSRREVTAARFQPPRPLAQLLAPIGSFEGAGQARGGEGGPRPPGGRAATSQAPFQDLQPIEART